MKAPAIPPNDDARVAELKRLRQLDTASESYFDHIVQLAAEIAGTPIALISLVDEDRQWFKAKKGLQATQTPRSVSFCGHAILGDEIFVVEDATRLADFCDNPLVTGDPNVIFYAGVPLVMVSGFRIGTLCVIDNKPRMLSDQQKWQLKLLAKDVVIQFELRAAYNQLDQNRKLLNQAEMLSGVGSWEWEIGTNQMLWSANLYKLLEVSPLTSHQELYSQFLAAVHSDDREFVSCSIRQAIDHKRDFDIIFRVLTASGVFRHLSGRGELRRQNSSDQVILIGSFQDISAQLQLQERLEDNIRTLSMTENRLSELIQSSPATIYEKSNEDCITFISPQITDLAGYSPLEVTSKPQLLAGLIHPEDRFQVQSVLLRADEEEHAFDLRYRIQHRDGDFRWVWERGTRSQKLGRQIGFMFDITAQQNALDLANTRTQELNRFFEISHEVLCVFTTDLRIKTCNRQLEQLLGLSEAHLNNQSLTKWIVEESGDLIKQIRESIKAGLAVENCHLVLKTSNDGARTLSWNFTYDEIQNLVFGSARDVTEDLAVRNALAASMMQLQEAQRVAKIGSWSFDLTTQKISWSHQMYELFSADPTLEPPSLAEHLATILPEDRAQWQATVDRAATSGEPYSMRFRTQDANGKIKWVEAIGRGRWEGGQVRGLFGTCQDVTEKLEQESQLAHERSRALHSSKLASLGEMSASVAHEINNPLMIINGNLDLIRKHLENPKKLVSKVTAIEKATQRISKIVSGLKKFSRASEASVREPRRIAEVVSEAMYFVENHVSRHQVTIRHNVDPDLSIVCDPLEIEQIIINLINNAVDAIENQPEKWIEVKGFADKGLVVLTVTDSGSGIPSEVAERLFDPFYTTKPVGKGTGLGLSIVKGIVEEHQGSIEVRNDSPNTCFELRFPLYLEKASLDHKVA